ncbi:MAG: NAD-dependent DNA ligase LigA [Clostridia bacterium]|nr:NAD-dependent DNA ligase LigA [Clostridia bacterium]
MSDLLNLFGEPVVEIDDGKLKEAKKEIAKLRKEINYHSELYYNQDKPEISDYEFDMLMKRLKALETEFPMLITKSSPTQRVGGVAKAGFSEAMHAVPMQSLNDVFSYAEVEEFVRKVTEEYGENTEFVVETKIDGLSVSLEYVDGVLKKGSTRGNGLVGEEITENLLQLDEINEKLNTNDTIEVRGEVYLSRARFDELNDELDRLGKPLMANSRNAAAGTLRQLDSNVVKQRGLSIFVFNVQKSEKKFETHSESLDYARKIGITTIAYSKVAVGIEQVLECITEIGNLRDSLPYDIDGAVVKVNNLSLRETLGTTTKVPKWAVAYKYPPEEKETVIEEIKLQVGRTGQVTPLAIVTPVRVAGSTISKCTLHNFDYIKEKDIRVGDTVKIRKAGDVIPEIATVVMSKRDKQQEYIVPTVCPVCGEILEKEDGQVALRCTNSECGAQSFRAIEHFASREAMDIDGLGEAIVEQLIDNGLVSDVADIYYLTYDQIKGLDKFKEKSSKNLIDAINESKKNSLDKLIFGLGIRHIGKKAAKVLAEHVDTIYDFTHMTSEDLYKIDEVGEKMADSVVEFFSKTKTMEIIDRLDKAGVNLKGIKEEKASHKLDGMTIVVTGSFDEISRNDLSKLIESHSGKVSSSVSKKTSLVIAGENAGSKLDKANELGVEIVDYTEFKNRYGI